MERATILEHLALAEKHIKEAEAHIAQQREIIAQIRSVGQDSSIAEKLLGSFEEMQLLHLADRDRIRAELAKDQ